MQNILFLGLGLWILSRLGKPAPKGQRSAPSQTSKTPQGARVVTTNLVLNNQLPCIDPAGRARVNEVKELQKRLKEVQDLIDQESQRSQPDEAYIANLSKETEFLMQTMTDKANDHAAKCKKFYEDFAKRSQTPTQTTVTTTTTAPAQRGV
jgi:hypothetical protein